MSFRFNFDLEVDDEAGPSALSSGSVGASAPAQAALPTGPDGAGSEQCYHCALDELLDALPERLAYSPLHLPFLKTPLLRRDLHDARFQLAAADDGDGDGDGAAAPVSDQHRPAEPTRGEEEAYASADTDLIPGLYEGGLKTWEGGVDLVEVLSAVGAEGEMGLEAWVRGGRVLEVGCGTALPSCYLLSHLLSSPAPTSTSSTGSTDTPETVIHIQDFNRPVLSLVSLPNLVLAALPHLPPSALREADEAGDVEDVVLDYEHGGDVAITPRIKEAFKALLEERRVRLEFTYGHWAGLARELGEREGQGAGYGLVLTAETIYSEGSVGSLIDVLRAATTIMTRRDGGEHVQDGRREEVRLEEDLGRLEVKDAWAATPLRESKGVVLVAAKVLYFGVGGGLQDFIARVQDTGGWSESVKEWVKGVGRKVVRIGWD